MIDDGTGLQEEQRNAGKAAGSGCPISAWGLGLVGAVGGRGYFPSGGSRRLPKMAISTRVTGLFLLGRAEAFVGSGFDLDEYQARIGIDHYQIDFPGLAREIAGERFEAFCSQELFAAFLAPSPELLYVGHESATI